MPLKHDRLEKRLGNLESKLPTPEDEENRRLDAFLSKCTDDELRRIIAITEKEMPSPEDTAFLEDLITKY